MGPGWSHLAELAFDSVLAIAGGLVGSLRRLGLAWNPGGGRLAVDVLADLLQRFLEVVGGRLQRLMVVGLEGYGLRIVDRQPIPVTED